MREIKFSHIYKKLLDEHNDVIETAKLLHVEVIGLADLQQCFLDYDTDTGAYILPKHGAYMMLIFLKPPDCEGVCATNLFTTIRRWTQEKEVYYRQQIGHDFKIKITQAEKK